MIVSTNKKMRKYVWDQSKYVCLEELHLIDKHSLSLGERERKGHFEKTEVESKQV